MPSSSSSHMGRRNGFLPSPCPSRSSRPTRNIPFPDPIHSAPESSSAMPKMELSGKPLSAVHDVNESPERRRSPEPSVPIHRTPSPSSWKQRTSKDRVRSSFGRGSKRRPEARKTPEPVRRTARLCLPEAPAGHPSQSGGAVHGPDGSMEISEKPLFRADPYPSGGRTGQNRDRIRRQPLVRPMCRMNPFPMMSMPAVPGFDPDPVFGLQKRGDPVARQSGSRRDPPDHAVLRKNTHAAVARSDPAPPLPVPRSRRPLPVPEARPFS